MEPLIISLIWLILQVINLYMIILVVYCILTLLVSFNVVNARQPFVNTLLRIGYAITEPVLAPIRRILPNMGGIDLSPIVVILLLGFLARLIEGYSVY
jgi:YggT family protein